MSTEITLFVEFEDDPAKDDPDDPGQMLLVHSFDDAMIAIRDRYPLAAHDDHWSLGTTAHGDWHLSTLPVYENPYDFANQFSVPVTRVVTITNSGVRPPYPTAFHSKGDLPTAGTRARRIPLDDD